jgi:hypothetical protein
VDQTRYTNIAIFVLRLLVVMVITSVCLVMIGGKFSLYGAVKYRNVHHQAKYAGDEKANNMGSERFH